MPIIYFIIFLVVGLAGAAGAYLFISGKRKKAYNKSVERGLKMVTLMIHLPPSSDDLEVGGRDARDLSEENISRAQVLYNILASISQKGKQYNKVGQRHIGLEFAAVNGIIRYYAAVPVPLITLVNQAIVSAYPAARTEEVPDYNIFNDVGKTTGTIGGEPRD
jgi:hypothetical protein